MPSKLEQSNRIGELITPLGKDELVLGRFQGTEGLSELFDFSVDAASETENLPLGDLLGKECSVTLTTIEQKKRHFSGIVTEAQWVGAEEGLYSYRLSLRPWLYLLSRRINSRIFHNKDAPTIIADIFGDHSFAHFDRGGLRTSFPKLEYCVQFRESDLAFVSRLMEQHGISYSFKHEPGKHTLVLGDSKDAFTPIPGEKRPYYQLSRQHRRQEEHLHSWVPERRFTVGRVTLNDYDFKKPPAKLDVAVNSDADYENGQLERYDAPGKYVEPNDGKLYAQASLDALRAADGRHVAAGDCMTAQPGLLVTLEKHPTAALNRQYLFVRCSHSFEAEAYRSNGGSGSSEPYHGVYEMLESDVDFAPAPLTPAPIIAGPQTATVVGRGEIDCDEHGRILVDFHWDRDHQQSMRCRVAQVWAGGSWGGVYLPRVGMEVLVQFLDGDPDRPVVIGSVYNATNKPPYPLPEQNLVSGWKTQSSPGGSGYNEFVFDDTAGDELVRMHAQYDHETVIKHDERRAIGRDRTTTVGRDETMTVAHEIMITAGNKLTLKVGMSTIVMDAQSITITAPTVTVAAMQTFESKAGISSEHKAGGMMTLMAPLIKIN